MLSIPSATASHLPLKPTTPPARADAPAADGVAAAPAADAAAVPTPAEPARREFTPPASALRDLQLPFSVGFGAGRAAPANLNAQQQAAAAAAQAAAAREAATRSAYVVPPTAPGARLDTSA